MNMYLLVAFLLLVVMLFLILRPFLLGTTEAVSGVPVGLSDPGAKARSMAKVERVGRAPEAAAEVAIVDLAVSDDTSDAVPEEQVAVVEDAAPAPASSDDVRAQVEAAIAARKAVLQAKPCSGCDATVQPGDAFCRSCGTKVTA